MQQVLLHGAALSYPAFQGQLDGKGVFLFLAKALPILRRFYLGKVCALDGKGQRRTISGRLKQSYNGICSKKFYTMRLCLLLAGLLVVCTLKTFAGSEGDVTAGQLLSLTRHGVLIPETKNRFRCQTGKPKNISLFSLTNAAFWTADMDIDSDGRETPLCNKQRDSDFQNKLSCDTDIAADETPYFVIPAGKPANSKKRGIEIGQVAAIIYSNQVVYAVFLDECGVKGLIGEASIATAHLLGVDADPKTGGTEGPVTYLVFTGESGRITDPKDYANHAKAVEIGVKRAKELLAHYNEAKPAAGQEKSPMK